MKTNKYFKEQNFRKALESNNRALELSIKEFGKLHLTNILYMKIRQDY